MYKLVILLFALTFSCNLLEPCYLLIKNESRYPLKAYCMTASVTELAIESGDEDRFLLMPGECEVTVYLPEQEYTKEYRIHLAYQEKKEIRFKIKE